MLALTRRHPNRGLRAFELPVDPIARQFRGCIGACQDERVARQVAKMFHDGACAELMRGLPGMGADLQHLTEGAQRFSGYLGCVIRTGVRDHGDPQ